MPWGQAGQPPADPATPVSVEHAPVTDGSAVVLPTVTYLGAEFVPAFTSAGRLAGWFGQDPVPPFAAMPHIVVPAAELARRMPPASASGPRA